MPKDFKYCVLYIQDVERYKLKILIERELPPERGEVFIPRMELYKRGEKKIREVTIFPGYVFLYTDRNIKEIHKILNGCRRELDTTLGELALRERWRGDPDFMQKAYEDEGLYDLSDLDEEETGFLDTLRQGDGLLTMSYGYEENGKYHVMEGPLAAFEDKIQKLDKHNKKAFLRFEINGKQAKAGFECMPKTHWFPKEDSRIVKLSDGTEVDLGELSRSVMTI